MSTRKELIAEGKDITPLTREEYFLAGKDIEPLNVKEKVLKGVVGGGGGSDLSTAKIKVMSSTNKLGTLGPITIVDEDCTRTKGLSFGNEWNEFEVVLYKGKYSFSTQLFQDIDTSVAPVLTGDVELDSELFEFVVTGDCTITVAGDASN